MVLELNDLVNEAKNINNQFNIKGKNAIVVGGNKGLGQAMSLALAGAGVNVCVVSRGPEGLSETAEAINSMGPAGNYFSADVTDERQVKNMVDFVLSKYKKIDILVNSQGTGYLEKSEIFDAMKWQEVMDVNLKSVFLCCKNVGKHMLERKNGKIINISSVRGFQGRKEDLAYAPSKGAVNQLTRSLAIEWGPEGINVNAIAPVFTITKMSKSFLEDKNRLNWVLDRIPMKRLGQLDDLFGPVIFLASDASKFINGHILLVDGGWIAA